MWTKEQIAKKVNSGKGLSDELKQLFKEHPEKKEAYIEKLFDSQIGGLTKNTANNPCRCNTCMFAEVIDPIGRQPQTRYCKIYGVNDSHGKPDEILWGNAPCEFYEKDKS